MPRIATRFSGPAQVATGPATKLTVAANEKAIIRNIHVYNPGPGSVNFTASIGADAAATRIFDAFPIAEDIPLDHWGYYVMEETEIFQAGASVNNQLVLTIDGERSVLG